MKMSTLKKKSDQSGSNHEEHINYSTDGENPETNSNLSKHASNSVLNLEHLDLANEVLFPEPAPLPNMSGRVKIEKAFAQGFLSYQRHQYLEASQQLQRALKGRHRGSFLAHFLQGLCNYSLGQFKLAHADFSVCCLVADSQARTKCEGSLAFYNRGLVHIKLNEIRKAADDISTAIEIFPEEMMFHSCRALLCRRLGRFEEAQNEYLTLRRLEAKVEKLNDGDKADNLKRQETIFVSSSLKKFSSSNISTSRSFHSANSTDLKAKLYGDLHQALTCRPGKRTKQQIDLLTEESRMMAAFSHFDTQQLSTLWQYFEYKNYPSNARIFEQGDEADDYFLVWSGSVSARINKRHSVLHHTSNVVSALAMEHEIKVNSMSAGETLGEAILSEDGIRKASCVTEEPTEMIFLNRKHFDSTFHLFLDKIRKEKIEFLSTFDFLSSWDTKILDTLAQICREKTYHSGDVIIKQDTSADSFYFIKTGIVSLVRTLATCEVNVKTLGAGEVFGETSLFKGNDILTFPHTAICDTMTVLYRVDRMQITKDQSECFANDATLATKIAAYPDDATLIKSHLEEQKFKKQRDIFIRNFRKKK